MDFDREILQTLEKLFDEGSIETLVYRSDSAEVLSHPVAVVHKPTSLEEVSSEYPTQIQNKALALAKLAVALSAKS